MKNERKNRLYTKDYVYLVDFLVNIGLLILIFLKSYEVSGSMMGGILTDSGILLIFVIVIDVLVIFCQLLYMIGRLRRKMPGDMHIVNRWPNTWIFGKILILAGFTASHFLGMDLISLLFPI